MLQYEDEPGVQGSQETQSQDGRGQWYVPGTIAVSYRRPAYWNTVGRGNERLIHAALQAEAHWVAREEKLLLQGLW